MAGIAVVSKTDKGSIMIRLIMDRKIIDRIEVEDVVFLDGEDRFKTEADLFQFLEDRND